MNPELTPPSQSVFLQCEAKFEEALRLWQKGSEELFAGRGVFVPDAVEGVCLDTNVRVIDREFGAWMILLRPGVNHPGVELEDVSTDNVKEVEFALVLFFKSEGETREFFEAEPEDVSLGGSIVITKDNTLVTDYGPLPEDIAPELAKSIADSRIVKKPDWLE